MFKPDGYGIRARAEYIYGIIRRTGGINTYDLAQLLSERRYEQYGNWVASDLCTALTYLRDRRKVECVKRVTIDGMRKTRRFGVYVPVVGNGY